MARQIKKLIVVFHAAILVCATVAFAGQISQQSSIKSTLIKPRGWSFSAPVTINGELTADLVIDSGSTFTVISTAMADKLGLDDLSQAPRYPISAAGGIVWVRLVLLETVGVGGAMATNVEGAVANLPSFKGASGLLGRSYLDRFAFRIDGVENRMELTNHKSFPLFGGRGEKWWKAQAQRLEKSARLFRAMELGVESSVYTGDTPDRLLKQKLSKHDAAKLAVYFREMLAGLQAEAEELQVPEQWIK